MSEENKRIVEINGVKVEVDLRTAKVIDCFKVGDPVRVFHPKSDYTRAEIKPGVIVGFCEFSKNPAIEIMELKADYSGVFFEIVVIAEGINDELQITAYDKYEGLISQADVVTKFDRLIQQKELELSDLKLKKKYFVDDFAKAFEQIVPTGGV
ncbi:hypothetical protein FACS189468_5610 [Spirochaetia bacterium]|nr:hypothetical protein FACS189468_5610 [Spirochaetia bacterium]